MMELQPYLENLGLNSIPLEFVPTTYGRSFTAMEKQTAYHEGQHMILAVLDSGPQIVDRVTVVPSGHALGQTVFRGIVPLEKFKIWAAAGAVDPPESFASGYGHDLWQVRAVTGNLFGSVEPEIAEARRRLNHIDKDERTIMAEIIAHMKTVPGAFIGQVWARARLEVSLKRDNKLSLLEQILSGKTTVQEAVEDKLPSVHTRIEYIDKHIYRIIHVKDGQEKAVIICGACGGENVHAPNLAISHEFLSSSGTIFSRN